MLKRLLAAGLCLLLATGFVIPVAAEETPDDTALPAAAKADDTLPARSAVLMEQESGRILFEKNADEQLPPASITKVMTLLLVMEAIEENRIALTDMVTCSAHASSMGGSQIWFKEGEQLSVDDLLKATCIASANDASVALAEHVAGSEDAFVDMMNRRAAELAMTNTVFMNTTGLDAPGHLSTARDIAIMSRELLRHERIVEYSKVWMSSLRDGQTQLVNTNKLVRFYNGCTGLKTGTTDGAGSCLSASATRRGMSLVAVTLGSANSADRFSAARGLLDYGFANFTRMELPPADGIVPVKVLRGVASQVDVAAKPPESVIVPAGGQIKITQEVTLSPEVEAPVEAGQLLGNVKVLVDSELLCEYHLVAEEAVDRMTFGRALCMLLESLVAL